MKRSDRDTRLGEQLRGLEVPEHAPDFFATLEQRLETEAAAPGRTTPGAPVARDALAGRGRDVGKRRRTRFRLAWVPIPVAMVILALLWASTSNSKFCGKLLVNLFNVAVIGPCA